MPSSSASFPALVSWLDNQEGFPCFFSTRPCAAPQISTEPNRHEKGERSRMHSKAPRNSDTAVKPNVYNQTFQKPTMLQKFQVHHSTLHSPRASVFSPPSKVPLSSTVHEPLFHLPLKLERNEERKEKEENELFIRCCPYHKQDRHSSMLASTSERLQWVGSAVAQTWYPRSNVHSQQYRQREREPQSPSRDITLPSMESCLMATNLAQAALGQLRNAISFPFDEWFISFQWCGSKLQRDQFSSPVLCGSQGQMRFHKQNRGTDANMNCS